MRLDSVPTSIPRQSTEGTRPVDLQGLRIARDMERTLRERGNMPRVSAFRTKLTSSEPEDAHITGMTRSLSRRLLGLNLRKPVSPQDTGSEFLPMSA